MFKKRSILRIIVCTMIIVFSIGLVNTCLAKNQYHKWIFDNAVHLEGGRATDRKSTPMGRRYIDGYQTTDGYYWVCMDSKFLFFRVQDGVLKCKTEKFYKEMYAEAMDNNLMRNITDNPKVRNLTKGHDYYIKFNCKDGFQKHYRLTKSMEYYGEEI